MHYSRIHLADKCLPRIFSVRCRGETECGNKASHNREDNETKVEARDNWDIFLVPIRDICQYTQVLLISDSRLGTAEI